MDDSKFADYFPIWNKLDAATKKTLLNSAKLNVAPKGRIIHNGDMNCIGVVLVKNGQLRAYITSETGKEVTLYRLFERDVCLFSASCMMQSIQFEITVECEKDTVFWIIPAEVYKKLSETSIELSNYTNELMSARFSDVMWIIDQILFKTMDERISEFLLNESNLENTVELKITHEQIAHHLGTAREVVTRLLKYLQAEGIVSLSRGGIKITDRIKLESKAGQKII